MSRKLRRWSSLSDESTPVMKIAELKEFREYLATNECSLDYDMQYLREKKEYHLSYELIESNGRQHLIIHDEDFAHLMRDTRRWFLDATFSVVPKIKQVTQLLTIMCEKFGCAIPAFWILMQGKITEDYVAVMEYVRSKYPAMKPDWCMSDFEGGMRTGAKKTFPSIKVSGCHFHYCQALYKNALEKGAAVKKNKQENTEKHFMLLKFMALAYLPSQQIQTCYEFLKDECQRLHGNYFDVFITYFENEWLKKVKAARFSVYRLLHTTNNFLESYHRLLKEFLHARPSCTNFLKKLKELLVKYRLKLRSLETDKITSCSSKSTIRSNVREYWNRLDKGEITSNDFVTLCANLHADDDFEECEILSENESSLEETLEELEPLSSFSDDVDEATNRLYLICLDKLLNIWKKKVIEVYYGNMDISWRIFRKMCIPTVENKLLFTILLLVIPYFFLKLCEIIIGLKVSLALFYTLEYNVKLWMLILAMHR